MDIPFPPGQIITKRIHYQQTGKQQKSVTYQAVNDGDIPAKAKPMQNDCMISYDGNPKEEEN